MIDADTSIAVRIRDSFAQRGPDDPFITYQALASAMDLLPTARWGYFSG